MTHEFLRGRLEKIFRDVFHNRNLEYNDSLSPANVPGWTSLQHVKLIAAIEAEFGIHFEWQEMLEIGNAGDILRILQKKNLS